MEIEFRILGAPQVRAEGRVIEALAPRYWRLLASMLLTPNIAVPTNVLAANAWGEASAMQSPGTVRSYISKIGKALSEAAGSEVHISCRREHGYVLNVDPQAVDLHRFRSLRRQAGAVAESGDHQHAALLLREAEALWRGPALAGLSGDWIARMRDSLDEEHRAAQIQCIEAELHLGRHAEMVSHLRLLSEQHPFDEKIIEHQMTALYRSGRQADAVRMYRQFRLRLIDEGLEPGQRLAEHHQRILRHDPGLAITPAYRRSGQLNQPETLPPDLSDFVGRETEARLLTAGIEHHRGPQVRVIEGMAGAGKTALAIHIAHRFAARYPDARLFVCFYSHSPGQQAITAADALHRLLRMLDVPAERIPAARTERSALWRSELANRRAVIVLDDVTDPDEIRPLLPATGDSLIIVTSRRRHADWAGMQSQILDALPDDDAITMFTRIAGPDAATDADEVAHAVQLCGRLPLAIRVTASQLRHGHTPGLRSLLDELSDFHTGREGTGEVSERMVSAFRLSYRELSDDQRRFFRYLGINPCPEGPAQAAMALTGATLADTEAALRALQDHHMLRQSSPGRYQLHDLIRAFAASRFRQEEPAAERRRALSRLLDYYLRVSAHASQVLYTRSRPGHLAGDVGWPVPAINTPSVAHAWLETEWQNILLLAQYAARNEWKSHSADLTHAIAEFLETGGYWHHAISAHALALQACRDLDDLARAGRAALDLSLISLRTGNHEAALQQARDAMLTYRTVGDLQGQAAALDRTGVVHRNSARFRPALAHHQEAMEIHRQIDDSHGLAMDISHAGVACYSLSQYDKATDYFHQALALFQQTGDRREEARTLLNMCVVQGEQGYHRDALKNCQESLKVFREIGGHRQQIALLAHNRGQVYEYKNEYNEALTEYRRALADYRQIGDFQHQSRVLGDIGSAYQGLECFSEALIHHEKAESMASEIGDTYARVKALCGMADAHRASGSYQAALDHYQRARRLAREIEAPYHEAKAISGIAETVHHTEGVEAARIHWREAYEIFQRLGVPEAAALEIRLDSSTPAAS